MQLLLFSDKDRPNDVNGNILKWTLQHRAIKSSVTQPPYQVHFRKVPRR